MTGLLTKRNISYLNVVLCILLILSLFFLARDIISVSFERYKSPGDRPGVTGTGSGTERMMLLGDYSRILQNNPFGFPGGTLRPLSGTTRSTATRTDIRLLGTVVGPEDLSYAIFADSTGMQEVVRIGKPVFGSGKLYSVKHDRALVRQGGKVTEIVFEDLNIREVVQAGSKTVPPGTFARRVGSGSYVVDQRKLQQAIENPTRMMTDARLKPNFTNGKEEGFSLSEVKPDGIYDNLGLQNGDILLRINEYDISNPERALQAFTALRGLDRVRVDLIRSGSRMTMTYQIR
jgi:general secretion pathway protein C